MKWKRRKIKVKNRCRIGITQYNKQVMINLEWIKSYQGLRLAERTKRAVFRRVAKFANMKYIYQCWMIGSLKINSKTIPFLSVKIRCKQISATVMTVLKSFKRSNMTHFLQSSLQFKSKRRI